MGVYDIVNMFNELVDEDPYKADALYYISLCWGCEGARLSYVIKYGDDVKYSQVVRELNRRKIMNIISDVCSIINRIVRNNSKFLEFFERDTIERFKRLSKKALKLFKVLSKLGIYESLIESDIGSILYTSMIVNSVLRSMFKVFYELKCCIIELVRAGLLVLCCIAPYEGLPHMYRVPIYSLKIWKMFS